ncbi:hypothetical protein LCGC14_1478990 [marine sediment metagenome]|uniref:Uncharacterized protein n=1 Tax=marine sediment metagenome TaxID=412755 RepID=A0A0F9JAQ2_9ZZZZ
MSAAVKISQETQILIEAIGKAIKECGLTDAKFCLNNVMINIGNEGHSGNKTTSVNVEIPPKILKNTDVDIETAMIKEFIGLVEFLPQPRFDSIFRLLIAAAHRESQTDIEAAQWLGINYERYRAYRAKVLPEASV